MHDKLFLSIPLICHPAVIIKDYLHLKKYLLLSNFYFKYINKLSINHLNNVNKVSMKV